MERKNQRNDSVVTSVSVSREFYDFCKDKGISFSDMIRKGIVLEKAELGLIGYPEGWNIVQKAADYKAKMNAFREKLENLSQNSG